MSQFFFFPPPRWRGNKGDPGNEVSVCSRTLLYIKVCEERRIGRTKFTHRLRSWQFTWLLGVFGENERQSRASANLTPGGFAVPLYGFPACSGALLQLKPVDSV